MKKIILAALLVAATLLTSAAQAATTTPVANDLTRAEAMLPGGETAGDLMTPTPTDVSMKVIRAILGGDMSTSSTTLPIIGDAMLVFNIIMLAIGSFIFTGVAVSGILRTGADGEALGKKWSNMWVPLRFGASTALLIPTGSGFSVGQVMTMAAIAMGVGGGDAIWRAASTSAVTRMGELSAYNQRINPADIEMAKAILKNELCLKNFERYTEAESKKLGLPSSPVKYTREVDLKTGAIYWSAIDIRTAEQRMSPVVSSIMPNGAAINSYRGICGKTQEFLPVNSQMAVAFVGATTPAAANKAPGSNPVVTPTPNTPKQDSILAGQNPNIRTNSAGAVTSIALPNGASGMINLSMQKMELDVKQAQQLGVYNAAVLLSRHADKIAARYNMYEVAGEPAVGVSGVAAAVTIDFTSKDATIVNGETEIALNNAVQEYKRAVATAVKIASHNEELTKKMIADANESGWVSSGVWFYQLAKIASDVKKKLDTGTTVHSTPIQFSSGNPPSESIGTANAVVDKTGGRSWTDIFGMGADEISDLIAEKFYRALGLNENDPGFMQRWFGYSPTSTDHPLIQLQQSGLMMMNLGLGTKALLYSGQFAVDIGTENLVSKIVGGATGVKDAIKNLATQTFGSLQYAAMVLIIAGIMKGFFIPLLPFIKLLKAVVMFFITVCEVLVATPLWIAFHMTPDGDGFASDRVQGGYGIVLEAALRPMLIVFGLLFAFLLMWPVMNLFAEMFVMATDAVDQGFGFSGIATVTGGAVTAGAIGSGVIAGAAAAAPLTTIAVGGVAAGMFMNAIIAKCIYLFLFVVLSYIVVDTCCDVIDILPANVMNWINVKANSGNNNMEQKVHNDTNKVEGDARNVINMPKDKSTKLDDVE